LRDALADVTVTAPTSFTFKGKTRADKPETPTITVTINRRLIAATLTTVAKKEAAEIIQEGNPATIAQNRKYDKRCRLPTLKLTAKVVRMNFEIKEGLIAVPTPTVLYRTWAQWTSAFFANPNLHKQYINLHLDIIN
jgi:hypothetical protein